VYGTRFKVQDSRQIVDYSQIFSIINLTPYTVNRFVIHTPQEGAIEGNAADDALMLVRVSEAMKKGSFPFAIMPG
jgi:hypothetical protein